eukprot:4247019-Pleurochrysis_carterae.AAC.3
MKNDFARFEFNAHGVGSGSYPRVRSCAVTKQVISHAGRSISQRLHPTIMMDLGGKVTPSSRRCWVQSVYYRKLSSSGGVLYLHHASRMLPPHRYDISTISRWSQTTARDYRPNFAPFLQSRASKYMWTVINNIDHWVYNRSTVCDLDVRSARFAQMRPFLCATPQLLTLPRTLRPQHASLRRLPLSVPSPSASHAAFARVIISVLVAGLYVF